MKFKNISELVKFAKKENLMEMLFSRNESIEMLSYEFRGVCVTGLDGDEHFNNQRYKQYEFVNEEKILSFLYLKVKDGFKLLHAHAYNRKTKSMNDLYIDGNFGSNIRVYQDLHEAAEDIISEYQNLCIIDESYRFRTRYKDGFIQYRFVQEYEDVDDSEIINLEYQIECTYGYLDESEIFVFELKEDEGLLELVNIRRQ